MASVINNIKSNSVVYNIASTAYATCATSASTAAKVAYIQGETSSSGFTLITGTTVHVKFTYANTASSPTLNINGTGAKSINCLWSHSFSGSFNYNYWEAGEVVTLTYDGTYWQINKSMPNFSSLNARLTALEQQLSSISVTNTLLIEMDGRGSIITHTDSSDSVATYNIKLYSDGASMGHTRWDNSVSSSSVQNPIASQTSTLTSVFYYKHHRIAIAIPAIKLTEIDDKTLVGLDLYFNTSSINTSGYTGSVAITDPISIDQIITISGDRLFTVYEGVGEANESILHLEFNRPYDYAAGSNLLILIKFDSNSYNTSHSIYGKVNLYYR